ncbi:MAG: CUB domain-containing protein [Chitinophagales bacterium]|nr:CUB domain-containing protein [Chitinophagales bacterium]
MNLRTILLLIAIIVTGGLSAQNSVTPKLPSQNRQISSQQYHSILPRGGSRAITSVLDYDAADESYANNVTFGTYYRYLYRLNGGFPNDSLHDIDLNWAAVVFDTVLNSSLVGSSIPANSTLDSVMVLLQHINVSGTTNRIIFQVYQLNANGGISVTSNNISNTIIYADTITASSSISGGQNTIPVVFYTGLNIPATGFAVGIKFIGDTTDYINLIGGYSDNCSGSCVSATSIVPDNSQFRMIYWQGTQSFTFNSTSGTLFFDCDLSSSFTPGACEDFFLQNLAISSYISSPQASSGGYLISDPATVVTCSGDFYDSGDIFADYSDNENYTKTFTSANAGQQIRFTFSSFETESGYDTLYIYDGTSTSSSLIGAYTGLVSPGVVTSSNGSLTFKFVSDGSFVYSGWEAAISCVTVSNNTYLMSNSSTVTTCSGTFYDSGNSGSNYSNNENFTKTFTSASAGQQIRFTFSAFSTEANDDYLYIYDGPTVASPLIGKYSGTFTPGTVTSTNGSLTFRFVSTSSATFAGWTASISCVATPTGQYLMYQSATVTSCSGNFYDSGNNTGFYSNDENLTKTFTSAVSGQQVRATFSSFDTESGTDILYVYDGTSVASPLIGTYSGTTSPGTITSTNGSLTFRFVTNSIFVRPGWAAAISCVSVSSVCTPNANVSSPGIYPPSDSIPCIVQNQSYNTTLTFKNYTTTTVSGLTVTIDSIRIDSIVNIPCGISWTTNKTPRNVYASGELGCIQLSGTTTDAVGQYKLSIYVTAWVAGFGTIPTELGQFGIRVDLRVKATSGASCPNVNTGITGLTANRSCSVALTANAGNDVTICRGNSTTLSASASGGTGSYTYAWSPSTGLSCTSCQSPVSSTTATTTYTVTVTSGASSATDQVVVTVQPTVTPSVSISSNPSTVCAGQSVTFTATGTNAGSPTYTWYVAGNAVSTGATYTTSSLAVGNQVYAQMTSTATCASPATVSSNTITAINCGGALSANAGNDVSICRGNSTTLSASASGGTGSYTYAWSPSTGLSCTSCQSPVSSTTATTTYTVTVTSGASTATDQVVVTVQPTVTPSVSISSNPSTVCAGQSVTFTATGINGGSPTYTWYVAGNAVSTGATYNTSSLAVGNQVYAQMTSTATCASPATVSSNTITAINCGGVLSVNAGNDVSICSGNSTTLSASASGGTGNYTYSWSPSTSLNCTNCQSPVSNTTVTRTYTVTVNDGTNSASDQVTVTVLPATTPSVTITSNPVTVCAGQFATFTASPGNGGNSPTYVWYANGSVVGSGSSYSTSNLVAGAPVYVVMTSNATCASPTSVSSNVIYASNCTGALSVLASNDITLCSGNDTTISATATGGSGTYSYSWSPSTGLSCTTCQSPTVNTTATRTYTINVSDGTNTATDQVTVTVLPSVTPSVTINSNPSTVCANQLATFTATPVNGGNTPSYTWYVNGGIAGSGTTYSSSTLPAGASVYVLMASSAVCAQPASVVSNVISVVNCTGALTVLAPSDISICSGENTLLTAVATGGSGNYTYSWSPSTGLNCTNCAAPLASPTTTTTYTVTANDGTNTATDQVVVSVQPTVNTSVTIASSPNPACASQAASFTATPINGGNAPSFQWYVNGLPVTTGNVYATPGLPAGTEIYVEMNSSLACASTATSSSIFLSNCGGALNAFISENDTICQGNSTVLTVQGDGGTGNYTYLWSPSSTLSSGNVSNPTASPLATTTYNVTVSDGSNTVTRSVTITVITAGFADAGDGGTTCAGGSVVLNASGGDSYQWSPSNSLSCSNCQSPIAAPASTTIYTVTVTKDGCTDTDDVTVTVSSTANASVTITADPDTFCAGQQVTFTASPVNGGTPSYQWQVDNQNVGSNTSTLSSGTLVAGQEVQVIMTSSLSCVTNPTVTSNVIEVDVCNGIAGVDKNIDWSLYPNPNEGTFYIDVDMPAAEKWTLSIITIQGQQVYAYSGIGSVKALKPEHNLSNGLYLVKISSSLGTSLKKLVLEK